MLALGESVFTIMIPTFSSQLLWLAGGLQLAFTATGFTGLLLRHACPI
jgi:hypothetical protein